MLADWNTSKAIQVKAKTTKSERCNCMGKNGVGVFTLSPPPLCQTVYRVVTDRFLTEMTFPEVESNSAQPEVSTFSDAVTALPLGQHKWVDGEIHLT